MTDEFVAHVLALGAEMEQDDSQLAKWLVGKARRAAIKATTDLLLMDPRDTDGIRDLQWEVARFRLLVKWIRDGIAETRNAFDRLDEDEKLAVLDEIYPEEPTNDA